MKGDDIIEIKIIGVNCSNGMKLAKMVDKAIKTMEDKPNVLTYSNEEIKNKYGITNVPGLIINDKLVSEGKVLNDREIKRLLLN